MIHVDVRPSGCGGYYVETSVDGGPWAVQLVQSPARAARQDAEACARAFVAGCRFAGASVRATSCGYPL